LLLLDTGDALTGGGPLGDQTQGEAIIAGMNLMGYAAMAIGPNELSLGLDVLQERMLEAQFPLLSANVVVSSSQELLGAPYTVLDLAGHRLAIIGLTRLPNSPLAGIQVLDPQQAAVRCVAEVSSLAGTVVVLTNQDYQAGLALGDAVPGIDLVIAALPGQLPTQAVRLTQTNALVVTAEQPLPRHAGRRVGRLEVRLGSDGRLSGETWESVSMGPVYLDDPEMQVLLDSFRQ